MPLEIERKFLIRLPDFTKTENLRIRHITQTYLAKEENAPERRIRRIVENGKVKYVFTSKEEIKKTSAAAVREEIEYEITEDEYNKFMSSADSELTKTRYSFVYEGHTIEIDVYPYEIGGDALEGYAVLEAELSDENEELKIPDFITVVRELTGSREFTNHALAKKKNR